MLGAWRGCGALVLVLATAGLTQAQDPVLWRYESASGARGRVLISAGSPRVLRLEYDDGRPAREATEDRQRLNTFWFPTSPGFAGLLEGLTADQERAVLTPAGPGFELELRRKDTLLDRGALRRFRAALLAPSTRRYSELETKAFQIYGRNVARWYLSERQYDRADVAPVGSVQAVIDQLEQAAAEGRPYARLVLIGHGGWDGPSLDGDQASSRMNPALFDRLVAAIQRGMTADGAIYSSSCHAGGSTPDELYQPGYRWSEDLARRTGRVAAGPAGLTSTEYTYQQSLATLDGVGVVKQETRWASPEGFRVIRPGGTRDATPLQPWPAPEPAPAPTPAASPVVDLPLGSAPTTPADAPAPVVVAGPAEDRLWFGR